MIEHQPFDDRDYRDATYSVNDLLSKPLDAWFLLPTQRRTEQRLRDLLTIPYDLAASEFKVSVSQGDSGWAICAERKFGKGLHARAVGVASDPIAALSQLADALPRQIDKAEQKARKRHRDAEREAVAEMIA